MSKTENVPCGIEAAKKLRIIVVKKYGRVKGYFGPEITKAVEKHTEELEQELKD